MTWTFDPLQALNAHFNVEKLGAVSDRYLVDFYGGAHTSFLLSGGTDRLWARWLLDDERVVRRLGPAEPAQEGTSGGGPSGGVRLDDAPALVEPDAGGAPRLRALPGRAGRALVFVPADVNALRRDDPGLAAAWRDATRAAFLEAFAAGFAVDGFARRARGPNGAYVLRRARGAA